MTDYWATVAYIKGYWIWEKHPVYHAKRGWIETDEEADGSVMRARCGLVLESWSNETGDFNAQSVGMRLEHAEAIGRPCRKCYPRPEGGST